MGRRVGRLALSPCLSQVRGGSAARDPPGTRKQETRNKKQEDATSPPNPQHPRTQGPNKIRRSAPPRSDMYIGVMARVPITSHTYTYIGSKFRVSCTPPHKWPKYVANASFSPRIPNGSGEGSASGTSVGRQGPKQPNSICILGSGPNSHKRLLT